MLIGLFKPLRWDWLINISNQRGGSAGSRVPQQKGRRRRRIRGSRKKPPVEKKKGSAKQRKAVLVLENFSKIPSKHQEVVKKIITKGLKDLNDVLEIDFSGNFRGSSKFIVTFITKWKWDSLRKRGHKYLAYGYGTAPNIFVAVISKVNLCENVKKEKTCTRIFPDTPEMLGKMIGFVAMHETGHLLGLNDEKSSKNPEADDEGHVGSPNNFMFSLVKCNEFNAKKHEFTVKYRIKDGETLNTIVKRRGLWSIEWLYVITGKDGKSNREILENKKPPFSGTEIWLYDIPKFIEFVRGFELTDRTFNPTQIAKMRSMIIANKSMLDE